MIITAEFCEHKDLKLDEVQIAQCKRNMEGKHILDCYYFEAMFDTEPGLLNLDNEFKYYIV